MRPLKPWFHKRKNCWVIEPGGKLIKLADGPKNAETKKKADDAFHRHMLARAANPSVDGGEPTVASVIDAFLTHDEKRVCERFFKDRKYTLQLFAEAHGWRKVRDCLPYHLTTFLDAHPEWKSDWTRYNKVQYIERPFSWAVKNRLISSNPFALGEGEQPQPGMPRRPVTEDEFRQLVEAASANKRLERTAEALRFIGFTGCRPDEVRLLQWSDIDLDGAVIVLPQHKTRRSRKDHAPRTIPLIEEVVQLLIQIRLRQEHDRFVFVRRGKQPWSRNGIEQNVLRLRRQIGLAEDVVLYGVRHWFGTRGVLNGVDLKTLAQLMGHSTTRMTEYYIHLAGQDRHLAEAMRKINAPRPGD